MDARLALPLLLPFAVALAAAPVVAQPAFAALTPTTVLSGLGGPIDFAVATDGSVWWNEYYTGNVTRYDPADGSRDVVFHAPPIPDGVERGMVGLALDPDVTENGVFYVYYTVADPEDEDGGTNRLSRIEDGAETVLLTVPANRLHNGGRIVFASDGSMFVSTGDNKRGTPAQDPGSPLGKILHLYPDGSPAEGNVEGPVYSIGHRNVYGLAYDAETGRLFATENGNAERDEVNLIEAGQNYGWPFCEGLARYDLGNETDTDLPCDDPALTPPIGEFYANRTVAPTGATVFRGRLYWASWNEGSIHRMTEGPAPGEWRDEVVFRPGGRINDLERGPDDALYYSNWTHIQRLEVPEELTREASPAPTQDGTTAAAETGPTPGVPFLAVAGLLAAAAAARRRRPERP